MSRPRNHFVQADWPLPDQNNVIHQDWYAAVNFGNTTMAVYIPPPPSLPPRAELQVQTALDYATNSWFWNTFSAALNHQTAHHLFPWVIQSHLPGVTPIVRDTCKEFGVRYNCLETGWQALASHANYMKKLGRMESSQTKDE